MKKLVKITFITIFISIFYLALSAVLAFTASSLKISLRTWVDVLGKMTAALIMPLSIIVTLAVWLHGRAWIPSAIKGILSLAAGAGYLFWAYWTVLFIVFGMQEERMIAPNLLVTNEAVFLSASEYVYYRPVTVFFKTPAELTDEIKVEYLERKYSREFMTDVSENDCLCDKEFPDVKISVYLSSMELTDDYVKQMTLKYLAEGYESLGMERGYHISKNYSGKDDLLYLEFDGEADIRAVSEDISQMISYCVEHTDLFREYYGNVGVSSDQGEPEFTFALPFGKLQWWSKGDDYYRDPDCIAELIAEKYVYYSERYAQLDEQSQQLHEEETQIQETTDYVEEGARALYEAVLADEGFTYDADYNAKGNFYVNLGEKDGCFYSLVYDHPSPNGACELYVLYQFAEEGSENYVIVDMYAVENATKKVVASGRKHWSDVGTKEYREITES
ncbi:MAG: hypothetical protein K2I96_25385 [Lachnospiraceae bacterium]|nr:hypothetical protein [Lachnospiraceae bacterium]